MKLGQLIEYNMRNIFLGKSCIKCGGKAIPRLSFKKLKTEPTVSEYIANNLWINSLKFYISFYKSLFLSYAKVMTINVY